MTIGIYAIINTINNKMYVGKSSNIERRFWEHKNQLTKQERDSKNTNRHLFSAVKKYGIDNFNFVILHSIDILDEDELKDLEIYYMDLYGTCDRALGYNLRRDSSTLTEVHPETRELLSKINSGESNGNFGNRWSDEMKQAMSEKKKGVKLSKQSVEKMVKSLKETLANRTEDDRAKVGKSVSEATRKFGFKQYDKEGNLIRIWKGIYDIILEHPEYHAKSIYSVAGGWKKTYRGFIWEKFYLEDKLEEDFV